MKTPVAYRIRPFVGAVAGFVALAGLLTLTAAPADARRSHHIHHLHHHGTGTRYGGTGSIVGIVVIVVVATLIGIAVWFFVRRGRNKNKVVMPEYTGYHPQ